MDSTAKEILDLLLRWIHLIAGIMWVGNSMLFNWLDRNLERVEGRGPNHVGDIWLLHSGAFYQVEKKFLGPNQMPEHLHWFKWQAYTTWMSGISLLILVYYAGGGGFLVDATAAGFSQTQAALLSLGSLVGGFALYDAIWRSPLKSVERVAQALSIALLAAAVGLLTHYLNGRAAYIHVGALMGSCMAGNVFFHIVPSQRHLVAATLEGREQDLAFSRRAKQRSIHNNYMTFPVLFIMISNHFPSTYGSPLNYAILGVIMTGGALVRHFMNVRFTTRGWQAAIGVTVVVALTGLITLISLGSRSAFSGGPAVGFPEAQRVIQQRCIRCHSATPTDELWRIAPSGIMFDTPEQIGLHAERINARAVVTKTMPFGNKTGITDEEREVLGRWFEHGAPVK